MANERIIVAGHSHTVCMKVPLKSPDGSPQEVVIRDGIVGLTGCWPRDREYWSRLYEWSGVGPIFLSWMGNQHKSYFLFEPEPAFDYLCARRPDLSLEGLADIVPESLIREFFKPSMAGLEAVLKNLKARGASATLLCPPPPKGDRRILSERISREGYFIRAAKDLNIHPQHVRVTDPNILLKLWTTMQEVMEEAASEHGFDMLLPPAESLTDIGFLKEEYWHHDVTHANAMYGDAVLDAIIRKVG